MGVNTDDRRFDVRGSLGAGGMGVVYRAFDQRIGREIALKVLRHATGADLYRFKREFRSIAGIIHPNLVALHELHTNGDEWFFTMDLIDGVSFIDWVRPGSPVIAPDKLADGDETATSTAAIYLDGHRRDAEGRCDLGRVRAALAQLADGLLALHVSGKLHRDLKPSNVLVDRSGRVIVLDFGLASDVRGLRADYTHDRAAVGTPAYMSPEQASDRVLTEASDWYAVGAILYEALTGARPFEGTTEQLLRRKQLEVPVRPAELVPGVPADLDELCMRLLAIRPSERPDGRTVLTALNHEPSQATLDIRRGATTGEFVGRAAELAALRDAFGDARERTVTVMVCGESGIGKSQLVQHFLAQISHDAIILEGRCYERESVPFRALDGVIDAFTGTLMGLPMDHVRAMMPRDIAALARLFPVLRRVPAIAERSMGVPLPAAPQELRRRAFNALRAMFVSLTAHEPMVIAIDDLQWGDADSAVFLAELAHAPEPLPLLLILSHRPEDNAGIARAMQNPRGGVTGGDVRTVEVGLLSEADARLLIHTFVDSTTTGELLVREGGGHPLFLAELARTAGHRNDTTASLDELIQRRLSGLPTAAVDLLRTVAVAARPLPIEHAARAAGIAGPTSELALLRAERLARVRVDDTAAAALEPYHDRVRRAVLASMSPDELRATHLALARAYESEPSSNRETLVAHWLAAGETARAASYAVEAATVAESAFAFHRAADLYALALEHGGGDEAARRGLRRKRAEALTSAGRLDEAADAFADAAVGAGPDEALELDTRRLEQLLRRGRLDEGMALCRQLLAGIGIKVPTTRAGAIRGIIAQLVVQRLRGLDFVERPEAAVPAATLRTIDLLHSTSTGLGLVDPVTGRLVQFHYLRAALDAGEPRRACVALAVEIPYLGERGTRNVRKVDALSARVRELADRIDDPYVQGRATCMRGFVSFLLGRWRDAALLAEAGLDQLQQHGVGVRWDFDLAEDMHLGAINYLGETREVARLQPQRLRDATERGDVYALGDLRGGRGNIAWLILGRPADARAHVDAVTVAPAEAPDLQLRHFDQLMSHAQIDLYTGDAAGAWQRLERAWRALDASLLLRPQIMRIEGVFMRARAALALALDSDAASRKRLLASVRSMARALAGEDADWADAFASQLRAALAVAAGDRRDATALLDETERAYAACDMRLHASVIRLRKGQLEGGTTGVALASGARDAMREQAIADPDAMAGLLCPWPA